MSDEPGGEGPDWDPTSVESIIESLGSQGYIADRVLATTVLLLTQLEKPVLLEGPAGVGKTELAKSLARASGRPLIRLQCYEGQDETKALYEWDYAKQLLYTQILKDKTSEMLGDTKDLEAAVERISAHESVFFSERFLSPRPLLQAVRSPVPVVLLIDEVDRADEALEAVLFEVLAEMQVSVPETGTFHAIHMPYVLLTSNNTRDLSAALKRRCLYLSLEYPSAERELEILRSHGTGLSERLAVELVDLVRSLRELDLRKPPSISETVDWARTLAVLGVDDLSPSVLSETMSVVIKYDRDRDRVLSALSHRFTPSAGGTHADHDRDHGHAHGDGHGHGSGHGHDSGREERAAKDRPGRHSSGYYGAPDLNAS